MSTNEQEFGEINASCWNISFYSCEKASLSKAFAFTKNFNRPPISALASTIIKQINSLKFFYFVVKYLPFLLVQRNENFYFSLFNKIYILRVRLALSKQYLFRSAVHFLNKCKCFLKEFIWEIYFENKRILEYYFICFN